MKPHSSGAVDNNKKNNLSQRFRFSVEKPRRNIIGKQKIQVSGWIFSVSNYDIKEVRIRNNSKYHKADYGISRHDVAKAHADFSIKKTKNSGFQAEFLLEDGELSIEVNTGSGFEEIKKIEQMTYSPEPLFKAVYNPDLAEHLAEHQNLIYAKKTYYYESETSYTNVYKKGNPKLIAFYLPQFHPIKENNIAWGKGFTEWTNVTRARPRFIGHQQPILPADFGFYDLRLDENIEQQVKLAKDSGLYGFCFYYYWFSGKKVLEKPLESFLSHKEWNFKFMICWANENWTKRWDGRDNDIIVAQQYLKSDPLEFIKSVEHILTDKRYIRQQGKPLLAIYRGSDLRDPLEYTRIWRNYIRKKYNLELEIVSMLNFDTEDPRNFGFDKGIEFAPLTHYRKPGFNRKKPRPVHVKDKLIDIEFEGKAVDYRLFTSDFEHQKEFDYPTYKCVSPSWDNEPRKKGTGSLTLFGSNPDLYAAWLDRTLTNLNHDEPVFINAWNEWAEGAVLEPSDLYGHAHLNRTSEMISKHSRAKNVRDGLVPYNFKERDSSKKIAIIVHIFYEQEWKIISKKLLQIDKLNYDLFVTITKKNSSLAGEILSTHPDAQIISVPNRGRDVLPFLFVAQRLTKLGYLYCLKLHTKRSVHRNDGQKWLEELLEALLSKKVLPKVIQSLENRTPLIGPKGHFVSLKKYMGGNQKNLLKQLSLMYSDEEAKKILEKKESFGFFAGTMFWCRLDAMQKIFDIQWIPEDFESEKGQIDGTVAHALERLFSILPQVQDEDIYRASKRSLKVVKEKNIIADYKYAP